MKLSSSTNRRVSNRDMVLRFDDSDSESEKTEGRYRNVWDTMGKRNKIVSSTMLARNSALLSDTDSSSEVDEDSVIKTGKFVESSVNMCMGDKNEEEGAEEVHEGRKEKQKVVDGESHWSEACDIFKILRSSGSRNSRLTLIDSPTSTSVTKRPLDADDWLEDAEEIEGATIQDHARSHDGRVHRLHIPKKSTKKLCTRKKEVLPTSAICEDTSLAQRELDDLHPTMTMNENGLSTPIVLYGSEQDISKCTSSSISSRSTSAFRSDISSSEVPVAAARYLFPYQIEGVKW